MEDFLDVYYKIKIYIYTVIYGVNIFHNLAGPDYKPDILLLPWQ